MLQKLLGAAKTSRNYKKYLHIYLKSQYKQGTARGDPVIIIKQKLPQNTLIWRNNPTEIAKLKFPSAFYLSISKRWDRNLPFFAWRVTELFKKSELKLCIQQYQQLKNVCFTCMMQQQIIPAGVSDTWECGVGSMPVTCCT